MDSQFGSEVAASIITGVIVLVIIAFALGALAEWGLPHLWHYLKPIIHAVTS